MVDTTDAGPGAKYTEEKMQRMDKRFSSLLRGVAQKGLMMKEIKEKGLFSGILKNALHKTSMMQENKPEELNNVKVHLPSLEGVKLGGTGKLTPIKKTNTTIGK